MEKYIATAVVTLGPGVKLELSAAQAKARSFALAPFKIDAKESKKPVVVVTHAMVQFKAGETFGLDGELPKVLADKLNVADTAVDADK
jgi:hypothetical protein